MKKAFLWSFVAILVLAVSALFNCREQENKVEKGGEINMYGNNRKIPLSKINMTVIYDNNEYDNKLTTTWGFSCLIKGAEETILFDTGGDSEVLLANMNELGVNPEEVDLVVLSHIHDDHTGGLSGFLEVNSNVTIYLPQSFPESFKKSARESGAKIIEIHEPLKITESVFSTGEMGSRIIEQSLIIRTDAGLIIITGCAHPGIVEIVGKAKNIIEDKVLFVMGGFHLGDESSSRIEDIISNFKKFGVSYAAPTHCAGDTSRELFAKEYQNNYINVGLGRVITIKDFK